TDTDEDGNSKEKIKTVTINQTNFALKAKDRLRNAQITYTAATSGNFNVQGNASWKAEITGMESAATFTVAAEGGKTLTDGTTNTTNVPYTTNAGNRYDYANVTFKDAETPKRFEDVTVSMVNCVTGNDPSIEEWARRAGFTDDEIAAVTNADAGSSAIKPINLIQLHRDQDDNLFLSGDFGNAGRWMLHNVRALNYSSKAPHSQGRTLTYSYATTYNVAQWGYPNASQTLFDNNPRVGLLYNWDAATGGKGGSAGTTSINDGEDVTTTPTPVQGICPDGWHLPSDWEWTQLEQEITTNTNLYSGTADIGGTIAKGSSSAVYRGSHAHAMKAPCPAPTVATATNGTSNTISISFRPGMNIMFLGDAYGNATHNYGSYGDYQTASGNGTTDYNWHRRHSYNNETRVQRIAYNRSNLFPVRCKKN
ncbi:fibrobacter succinogenes major paralogous domain-containing protein, partial [Dysgonomonas sp. 25]|uniref:fibrobacter succinogenes major paralogous domain-containing protein n=1 Tax=Dysgonomonas sp. 25 TaxID=2302933 RepID=UPI001C881CB6